MLCGPRKFTKLIQYRNMSFAISSYVGCGLPAKGSVASFNGRPPYAEWGHCMEITMIGSPMLTAS